MKRVKENLLIIITILLMLIINLTNTVYAEPLTRVDGSVRVENVGGSPTYKSSNLKLQKLNYINRSNEINSVDFQGGKSVSVFSEKADFSKVSDLVEQRVNPINNNETSKGVSKAENVRNKMVVSTGDNVLGSIGYEDFYLIAKEITTEVGAAYCLEVEKEYPNGEMFEFEGTPEKNIIGIMAAGYPNKSAEELGLTSDGDAYFATQMAIWCVTEGYIPKKFKSSDKNMLQTIKNIYEEGMQYSGEDVGHIAMEYYYNDSVQRIVAYIVENEEVMPPSEGGRVEPDVTDDTSNDFESWPDIPDDEEMIESRNENESESVIVPGLG
ncbi:thioester domain-containing protein [Clostridium saudiense]|uniref:thioester domain-containing protein n=1 Tax=Clostridium saudiense TaxID=1414720 RepID=UPI0008227297|nr:thioester domain-containing protein [Clostridium saudiense]MDU7455557.1 thioester domain-containing protein [Clostridium saudiense]SCJ99858.1 TQXA domain [uncultured Clostridium sp.]